MNRNGRLAAHQRIGALPDSIEACLFDLDGVLTQTARLHDEAWKQMFDAYLRDRARRYGRPFEPFDKGADYEAFVDGRQRYDGVRSFLASRSIKLPDGKASDASSVESVSGLGNRKNELYLGLLKERGVEPYPGSLEFVRRARESGLWTAVVCASANCREVLRASGIEDLFEVRVDGITLEEQHLRGKPAPDSFLAAAAALGVAPAHAAVFEDAPAGVTAVAKPIATVDAPATAKWIATQPCKPSESSNPDSAARAKNPAVMASPSWRMARSVRNGRSPPGELGLMIRPSGVSPPPRSKPASCRRRAAPRASIRRAEEMP